MSDIRLTSVAMQRHVDRISMATHERNIGKKLQDGGVSNETVKCGLSSAGLGPQSGCSGKAQKQLYE
jgi:hypothetical protein